MNDDHHPGARTTTIPTFLIIRLRLSTLLASFEISPTIRTEGCKPPPDPPTSFLFVLFCFLFFFYIKGVKWFEHSVRIVYIYIYIFGVRNDEREDPLGDKFRYPSCVIICRDLYPLVARVFFFLFLAGPVPLSLQVSDCCCCWWQRGGRGRSP